MGESFTLSDAATHSSESRPTLPSSVAEDDDEPPSSGLSDRPFEVKQTSNEPDVQVFCSHNTVDQEKHDPTGHAIVAPVNLDAAVTTHSQPTGLLRRPIISKESRLRALFTPVHSVGPRPTYSASFMAALKYTPLNLCLLFIPVSWALHYMHQSATLIFIFSCLGIVPLAALLGLGTEQIALRTSQSFGGLLNATLGNLVEMIIAGIALKQVSVPGHCLVLSSLMCFVV